MRLKIRHVSNIPHFSELLRQTRNLASSIISMMQFARKRSCDSVSHLFYPRENTSSLWPDSKFTRRYLLSYQQKGLSTGGLITPNLAQNIRIKIWIILQKNRDLGKLKLSLPQKLTDKNRQNIPSNYTWILRMTRITSCNSVAFREVIRTR